MAVVLAKVLYLRFSVMGCGPEVAVEDNRLKHRLVGATVLVALGVVLFPLWLDMHPAPGTRLEKTNIPERPQWHFFKSEEDETQSAPPPAPTIVAEKAVAETPPIATAKEIPEVVSPPVAEESPLPPPSPSLSQASIRDVMVKSGDTFHGLLAKAGVRGDQARAVLKLSKTLENLLIGRNLWVKAGPQKELQELIYYGPGKRIHVHVIQNGENFQLADSTSAIRALSAKESAPAMVGNLKQPIPRETPVVELRRAATAPRLAATPSAWVVQIASLNREENARALRDNLRSKGFPAFLESLYEGSHKLWRVRVGPSIDRTEVNTLRSRLEREAHLPGQILPYP